MAHSGMKTSVASGHLRMFRRFIQLNGVTKQKCLSHVIHLGFLGVFRHLLPGYLLLAIKCPSACGCHHESPLWADNHGGTPMAVYSRYCLGISSIIDSPIALPMRVNQIALPR